jgi:hypothetical protein
MSADLHVHSAKGVTDEDLACFFVSSYGMGLPFPTKACADRNKVGGCAHWIAVTDSPDFWVGEVSSYPSEVVNTVEDLLGATLVVLDEKVAAILLEAVGGPQRYAQEYATEGQTVGEWLEEHKGERLFTVLW